MVKIDALEGTISDVAWWRYDLAADVLYLRLAGERQTPTYAEETPDGSLLLRRQDNDAAVGLTVVNWWKRYGSGPLPDSIRELERQIEPWASRLAA
jgi:hypothetical protein